MQGRGDCSRRRLFAVTCSQSRLPHERSSCMLKPEAPFRREDNSMKSIFMKVLGGSVLLLAMALTASGQAPSPPFRQCPPIGRNTSCAVLITFQKDGTPRVDTDPSQGPFDGIEDTSVGVQNNSNRPVFSITLKSSTDIFGFDGDGLCGVNPRPGGCPFGPTGYEGPGVT